MDDREILSLYQWAPGACFRCAGDGETTRLQILTPPAGGNYDVRACRDCLLDLEAMTQRAAERAGCTYSPGQLSSEPV